jgi:hypothetical protein
VEAIYQLFDPAQVRAFSLDVWDGSEPQADLFQNASGTSFPVLLNASYLQDDELYDTGRHTVFVVDGEGIVRYRGPVDPDAITPIVEEAVGNLGGGTAVGDVPGVGAFLGANYPNPFNPVTRIPYEVPLERDGASVQLDVLDLRGRVVRTLVSGAMPAGGHEVVFDGLDRQGNQLPSGTYLARLRVDGASTARVMTLVK